jgi:hypothetical protein
LVLKYSPMCKINLIHNTRTKCYWCQERRSYYVEEWNIVISIYILQVFCMSDILIKNIKEKKTVASQVRCIVKILLKQDISSFCH